MFLKKVKDCIKKVKVNMKNLHTGIQANERLRNAYMTACGFMTVFAAKATAFAAGGDATEVFTLVIRILGGIAIIKGAISTYSGLTSYADAKTEGEGPKMARAKDEISGAIILVAIGLVAEGFAGQLAGLISSAISF